MNTVGHFHTIDTFIHRANKEEWVIVGNLLDGTITVGNFMSFTTKMGEKTFPILRIEKGQSISGKPIMGFLIKLNDQTDITELKLLKNTEIKIKSV